MNPSQPHYLLYCQVGCHGDDRRWRFQVRADDGSPVLEADDAEPDVAGDRLELLTVVRGLEALDQPARVTLSSGPYVRQGIQYGLTEWRDNGWRWEWFGKMVPVKNADLWQRLDHILQFHHVACQQRRFDPAHGVPTPSFQDNHEVRDLVHFSATPRYHQARTPAESGDLPTSPGTSHPPSGEGLPAGQRRGLGVFGLPRRIRGWVVALFARVQPWFTIEAVPALRHTTLST